MRIAQGGEDLQQRVARELRSLCRARVLAHRAPFASYLKVHADTPAEHVSKKPDTCPGGVRGPQGRLGVGPDPQWAQPRAQPPRNPRMGCSREQARAVTGKDG
ncbi:hypothetical protein GCM10010271_56710 [Streptomyces kurssanovii]|nr:hypothetical protein GCM10010271_56710 [Streptomyces kurssanovii]